MSLFAVTLNANAAATFNEIARSLSLFILHLKQPDSPNSLDGSVVLHVVELFLLLGI
jgi:hypothetical protein